MRPKRSFLLSFVNWKVNKVSFTSTKCSLEFIFCRNRNLIRMIIMLKVNKIMQNVLCSHKTLNLDNSSEKLKYKKIFLIPNSTLHALLNDTTHISLQWKNWSTKIVWTKENHLSIYFPPPQVSSEQKKMQSLVSPSKLRSSKSSLFATKFWNGWKHNQFEKHKVKLDISSNIYWGRYFHCS